MIRLVVNDVELKFEHSLVSLSDWEAEYKKPFYPPGDEKKTNEEFMRYFEYMLLNKKHAHLVQLLSHEQIMAISEYMADPRTATTIRDIQQKGRGENITSELIYYWLVALEIPFKPTDEWHLNRLLMLVKVCGVKQGPPPKNSRQNQVQRAMSMRELNEKRLRERGTKG